MDIPDHLIDIALEVHSAEARYRSQTGINATTALAAWSDSAAAYNRAVSIYAKRHFISVAEVRQALEEEVEAAASLPPDE